MPWAVTLIEDIVNGRESDVEIDHTKCGFGLFLAGDWNKELEQVLARIRKTY